LQCEIQHVSSRNLADINIVSKSSSIKTALVCGAKAGAGCASSMLPR
jgi:hypothetical protein